MLCIRKTYYDPVSLYLHSTTQADDKVFVWELLILWKKEKR